MVKQKPRARRRIQSIEVGFRVIRALESAHGDLPLTRIAAQSQMSVSKAYVYMSSFLHEGLARQDPVTGHYGLGPFAAQLGVAAIRNMDVVSVARADVDQLREETRCAASLAVWSNRGPTILLKADGEGQGSMTMRVGHVLSPLSSASGLVFQAWLPEAELRLVLTVEKKLAKNGNGAHSGAAMQRERVAKVRALGYSTSESGPHAGFAAVSAPVFDYSGAIVAALAVLGPVGLVGGVNKRRVLAALLEGAANISARLGHTTAVKGLMKSATQGAKQLAVRHRAQPRPGHSINSAAR